MASINDSKYKDFTLLVVDDDEQILNIYSQELSEFGFNVVISNNGMEAVGILKEKKIDIMIIDFFMPELKGEDVIKEIREYNKELIILLQTGYAGDKPAITVLKELKIQGYHDKTQGFEDLLIKIISCVRVRAQQKKLRGLYEELEKSNSLIEILEKNNVLLSQRIRLSNIGQIISNLPQCFVLNFEKLYNDLYNLENMFNEFMSKLTLSEGVNIDECNKLKEKMLYNIVLMKGYLIGDLIGINYSSKYLKEKIKEYSNIIDAKNDKANLTYNLLYGSTAQFIKFLNNELLMLFGNEVILQASLLDETEDINLNVDISMILQILYTITLNLSKFASIATPIYIFFKKEENEFLCINIEIDSKKISEETKNALSSNCEDKSILGLFSCELMLKRVFNGVLVYPDISKFSEKTTFLIKLPINFK